MPIWRRRMPARAFIPECFQPQSRSERFPNAERSFICLVAEKTVYSGPVQARHKAAAPTIPALLPSAAIFTVVTKAYSAA